MQEVVPAPVCENEQVSYDGDLFENEARLPRTCRSRMSVQKVGNVDQAGRSFGISSYRESIVPEVACVVGSTYIHSGAEVQPALVPMSETANGGGDAASGIMTLAHFAAVMQREAPLSKETAASDVNKSDDAVDSKPHACTICGRRFIHKANLANHIASHSNPSEYACSICGKQFSQKGSVRVHERIHDQNSGHSCPICGKTSSTKGNLKSHLLTHTGQKPFQCTICLKSVTQKHTLTTHERVHTGARPFKCEICSKAVICRSKLKIHQRVHERQPEECPVCQKTFTTFGRLNHHMQAKHGVPAPPKQVERGPTDCQLCPKSFTTPGRLHRHLASAHPEASQRSGVASASSSVTEPSPRIDDNKDDLDGGNDEEYGLDDVDPDEDDDAHTSSSSDLAIDVSFFNCRLCQQSFSTSADLDWHLHSQHNIVRPTTS
nr:zinc-finger protein [Plasmodiophora brassicae]